MAKKNNKNKKLAKKYVYRRAGLIIIAVLIVFIIAKSLMNKTVGVEDNAAETAIGASETESSSDTVVDESSTEDVSASEDESTAEDENISEDVSSSTEGSSNQNLTENESSSDENLTDENATDNSSSDESTNDTSVAYGTKLITLDSGIKIDTRNYLENSKKIGVTENEDGVLIIDEPAALDVVCDKIRSLPKDYAPSDLVSITDFPTVLDNPEINQIREIAYDNLVELVAACKEDIGIQLYGRSGYRSYNTQVALFKSYAAAHGETEAAKFSARPGTSEHQTGLAIDLTSKNMNYQLDTNLIDFEEGKWLADHAYEYGFIIRFLEGEDDITGYMYEPWHIRYLGVEMATEVYNSELTLEEYMFGDRIDE